MCDNDVMCVWFLKKNIEICYKLLTINLQETNTKQITI